MPFLLFMALDDHLRLTILLHLQIVSDRRSQRTANRQKVDILSEQQNHRCCYCGVRFLDPPPYLKSKGMARWRAQNDGHPHLATVEHVIRRIDGGATVWENEVAACAYCNQSRNDVDAYEFFTKFNEIRAQRKAQRRRTKARQARRRQMKLAAKSALGTLGDVWPGKRGVRAPQLRLGKVIADEIW